MYSLFNVGRGFYLFLKTIFLINERKKTICNYSQLVPNILFNEHVASTYLAGLFLKMTGSDFDYY